VSGIDIRTMRVDQIGSLLRPPHYKSVFGQYLKGLVSEQEFIAAREDAIRQVIHKQVEHHLPIITDGEYHRLHFMESFGEVAGMSLWEGRVAEVIQSLEDTPIGTSEGTKRGVDPTLHTRRPVTRPMHLIKSRLLEEYHFATSCTTHPVKVSLIDTDRIAQGIDLEDSRSYYTSMEGFLRDVVSVERRIVEGLANAGCRYVQIDGPSYTRYVDAASLEVLRSLGEDPIKSLERSIEADNAVIEGFPGVTFGLHVCRGNRRSMWHREGAYDAIAERLFTGVKHQRLLLEYDTERAGSFEPLRFVPKEKIVVLGLITTKLGRIETVDELRHRIDGAAKYLPLEQLALSPQCGFSSDIRGNHITEDEQWRKLDVMLETAAQVWG
jgi:methionine synthase II (cobalamin-independent)